MLPLLAAIIISLLPLPPSSPSLLPLSSHSVVILMGWWLLLVFLSFCSRCSRLI
jgi:hypothetical protein